MKALFAELRRALHAMYTASVAISSGVVANSQRGAVGYIGTLLGAVGGAIPVVGSMVSAVGAVVSAADNLVELEKLKNISRLAINEMEFSTVAEHLARDVVLLRLTSDQVQGTLSSIQRWAGEASNKVGDIIRSSTQAARQVLSLPQSQAIQDAAVLGAILVAWIASGAHFESVQGDIALQAEQLAKCAATHVSREVSCSTCEPQSAAKRTEVDSGGGTCCHQ
jgi:hypothetical protein